MKRGAPIPKKAREAVLERSRGYCEAGLPGCTIMGQEVHHKKLRSRGGSNKPVNLLLVCHFCHQQITDMKPFTDRFRTFSHQKEGESELDFKADFSTTA